MKGSISGIMGYAFFAIKPSSGRRACTSGHWTAKEIERDARDAAVSGIENGMKLSNRRNHFWLLLFIHRIWYDWHDCMQMKDRRRNHGYKTGCEK